MNFIKVLLLLCISTPLIIASDSIIDPELYLWCQEVRDIGQQPFDALLNLGGECQVAYQMRLHGIRAEALPFDWNITPFSALEKILKDRFEHFLEKEHLVFIHNEKEKYILDTYYGIRFLHDFKLDENFMDDYEKIKIIYERRIERFLNLLQESNHALFIRKKVTKDQAIILRELLKELYPNNNFLILAVDNSDEIKTDWQLENIKNFYLRPPVPLSWKGDASAWEEIFLSMGLHLAPAL